MNNTNLYNEGKAYLKRKGLPDQVIRIAPEINHQAPRLCFELYAAYGNPDYLGRILFDEKSYWIYDGDVSAWTSRNSWRNLLSITRNTVIEQRISYTWFKWI